MIKKFIYFYPIYVAELSSLPISSFTKTNLSHILSLPLTFFSSLNIIYIYIYSCTIINKSKKVVISFQLIRNGTVTVLRQGWSEERTLDSRRRPKTFSLHWRTWPWKLACLAYKSWCLIYLHDFLFCFCFCFSNHFIFLPWLLIVNLLMFVLWCSILLGLQRCGKSCRLRWTNYLRPDIKRGKFNLQEEQTIIQLHALLGNRYILYI